MPKKLIEIDLPIKEINELTQREKNATIGHPSSLHIWWARRPNVTVRAIVFATLVNDPEDPEVSQEYKTYCENLPTISNQYSKTVGGARGKLFDFMVDLIDWKKGISEKRANICKKLILMSSQELPCVVDPFAGGGTIPFQAMVLGANAFANDLNPVAYTMNKTVLELMPKFIGAKSIVREKIGNSSIDSLWDELDANKLNNLIVDFEYYAKRLISETEKMIMPLYVNKYGDKIVRVQQVYEIKSPYCDVYVPITMNSIMADNRNVFFAFEPYFDGETVKYRSVRRKNGFLDLRYKDGTSLVDPVTRRKKFFCVVTNMPIEFSYIRECFQTGKSRIKLCSVLIEKKDGKLEYFAADELPADAIPHPDEICSDNPDCIDFMDVRLVGNLINRVGNYGIRTYGGFFTKNQRRNMVLLARAFQKIKTEMKNDIYYSEFGEKWRATHDYVSYYKLLATLLFFATSRVVIYNNRLTYLKDGRFRSPVTKLHIHMVWDTVETNVCYPIAGSLPTSIETTIKSLIFYKTIIEMTCPDSQFVTKGDAVDILTHLDGIKNPLVFITDPPYYNLVEYTSMSSLTFNWMKINLGDIYPEMATDRLPDLEKKEMSVPENVRSHDKELYANKYTSKFSQIVKCMRERNSYEHPFVIFYGIKGNFSLTKSINPELQSAVEDKLCVKIPNKYPDGWKIIIDIFKETNTCLVNLHSIKTEKNNGAEKMSMRLSSSIMLVCRHKVDSPRTLTISEFVDEMIADIDNLLKDIVKHFYSAIDAYQFLVAHVIRKYTRDNVLGMNSIDALLLAESLFIYLIESLASQIANSFAPYVEWVSKYSYKQVPLELVDFKDYELLKNVGAVVDLGNGHVRAFDVYTDPIDWQKTDNIFMYVQVFGKLYLNMDLQGNDQELPVRFTPREIVCGLLYLATKLSWLKESKRAFVYNHIITRLPERIPVQTS